MWIGNISSAIGKSLNNIILLSRSLRYRIIVLVIFIVLLPTSLTGIYMYSNISKMLTNNADNELEYYINQINDGIDSRLSNIDNTLMLFLSNRVIRSALEDESSNDNKYKQGRKRQEIDKELKTTLLFNYAWDSKLIKTIFIFESESMFFYTFQYYVPQINLIKKYIDVYKSSMKLSGQLQIMPPTPDDNTIYFIRNFNNLNNLKLEGKLIVGVDEGAISKVYENLDHYNGVIAFLYDSNGIVLSHTDKNMLGQKIDDAFINLKKSAKIEKVVINNQVYLVASKNIIKYNLVSIIAVPEKQLLFKLSTSVRNYIIIITIFIIVFLLLGLLLSSAVTKPIKDIMEKIGEVQKGNFATKMLPHKVLEVDQLSSVFNKMTEEIQYLINQVYEKQLLLKESELASLRSQINPHFLFNVLETIGWEARMVKSDKIYKMVISLGEFLRANISINNCEKIKIKEELRYIEFYLELQKMRFGDRLETNINICCQDVLEYYIPKLCIQPIVENAIIHGFENKRGKGILNITISMDESSVCFEITDNGKGFNPEMICLESKDNFVMHRNRHNNIGLYNANRRIKLLYGEQYGIFIQSTINKGTKATVLIPFDKGGDKIVQSNDCR